MSSRETIKQFTLRLPADLYAKSVRVAKRRKMSLNQLARTGLEQLATDEAMIELKAAYDLLGSSDQSDVEFMHSAFAEVIRGE
jgi:hypothetical protein